ncbi:MAG: SDR family NAD(P)-dependent oxidoreductase, partial [Pseudomonadota bacterium]|nr:SDR family NAD(P)-dependent oxidoreductase [Pseudomonadota bacterium]
MTDQPIPRMPSFRLEGRRAVVTGAGRGLGRACAHALAEAGAHVIAVARSADELAALVAEITAAGGSAEAAPCDVMDMAALAAL